MNVFALLAAALVAAAPAADVAAARAQLAAQSAALAARGIDASAFVDRLDALDERRAAVGSSGVPAADVARQTALELALDAQVLSGAATPFPGAPGASTMLYVKAGAAADPVAVYVPQPDAQGRYGLVTILHGGNETETDVISHEAFRKMADREHAILIAPWAGGSDEWDAPAQAEIAALQAAAKAAFSIEDRHVYLAGISKGGAGAFRVMASAVTSYAGLLSIMGEFPTGEAALLRNTLRDRRIYAVFGESDELVPLQRQNELYASLALGCVPISLYIVKGARHDLYQVFPVVDKAWSDMFAGIIRNTNSLECTPGTG